MDIEKLMIPRYKVIANWPDMLERFSVGYVFEHPYGRQYITETSKYDPADYPHLFKRLEWWQERKLGDMPEYVKSPTGRVAKAKFDLEETSAWFMFLDNEEVPYSPTFWMPSTEAEFLACQNQQTVNNQK